MLTAVKHMKLPYVCALAKVIQQPHGHNEILDMASAS